MDVHSIPNGKRIVSDSKGDAFDTLSPEKTLKDFLDFARNVLSRYEGNLSRISELESAQQDILHKIELSDKMNACHGYDMYQKLFEIRSERRDCKDENDLLKPLYQYFADKMVINKLAQLQGNCRTAKQIICNRSYTARTDIV